MARYLKTHHIDTGQRYNVSPEGRQSWLTGMLVLMYAGLVSLLVFLPGGSVIERLRWLDSGICAQLPTHSFYPGSEQLPLCARNTGIYLGFMVTLLITYAVKRGRTRRMPRWSISLILLAGFLAMVIDGFNAFFHDLGMPHLYEPNNLLRLATGLLTGLALASLTLPHLNRLLWREWNEERSIPSWKVFLLLVAGLVLSFVAVATQTGIVLYPLAFLSTAGLITALSSVNLIVIIAICKRDETFERYRELLPFFSLTVLLAIGELFGLAQLKFELFHALGI